VGKVEKKNVMGCLGDSGPKRELGRNGENEFGLKKFSLKFYSIDLVQIKELL
jgi:hypothetical protein